MSSDARRGSRAALLLSALLAAPWTVAVISGLPAAPQAAEPLLVPDRMKTDTLVILAHPDDEGVVAPLLARYALEEKRQVVNIYLTSGEFGTDRVGGVRGPAFGYMRLTELHWTLDRLGVAMFHTLRRSDLGRSEDPAVVLSGWDRDRTVRELVRHIRLLRPERVLAWFPGPASSHVDHIAAGAAALLACRAAASPQASPEQMETEGLRPHSVPEIRLFFQAEKVGYDRYPDSGSALGPPGRIEEIPVDVYSAALGRKYTDAAREALKEQRSVGVAMGLGRGGAFDEPLRLIRVPAAGPAPPAGALSGVGVALISSGAQKFLESIAAESGAADLGSIFIPEARVDPGGVTPVSFRVTNGSATTLRARAAFSGPQGWKIHPEDQEVGASPGGSADVTFTVEAPAGDGPLYATAGLAVREGKGRGDLAGLRVVLRRRRAHPGDPAP